MNFKKVCVVGSGYLGTQIGVLCAKSGYTVTMQDLSEDALRSSKKAIKEYVQDWIESGEISKSEADDIKKRINFTLNMDKAVQDAGIVIEAVVEQLDIKREVFRRLDDLCAPQVLLATNSSSIKISHIEDVTKHPERTLNMHFYSYPWRRGILELMKGTKTTQNNIETARKFSHSIGVYPLIVLKESTGFIFNRVWRAIKKECLKVVDEGVATFEDVDRAWMSLYGTEIGPFGMMDRVGLDVVHDIELVYYGESKDPRDKPPKILIDKIRRGELGVKTGKGFYNYPNPEYRSQEFIQYEK